jgi:hypothetical protein
MARIRKIHRNPNQGLRNYYLVDACFLVNRFIPIGRIPNHADQKRVEECNKWWSEIENQLNHNKGRVYIPDVCIAEAFKVLAKKYYVEHWFKTWPEYNSARKNLIKTIQISSRKLKSFDRKIRYHDIPTNRDIIISVDRFYELFMRHKKNVQIMDLILGATARYLIDFYDIPRSQLHIVTLDKGLYEGIKKAAELQNVYDPTLKKDCAENIFL